MRPGDLVFVGPWTVISDDAEGYWVLDGGDGRTLGVPTLVAHEDAIKEDAPLVPCPICHRHGCRLDPDPNCPRCGGTFLTRPGPP